MAPRSYRSPENGRTPVVDPSLRAGSVFTAETVNVALREFWHDDPTETWQPYIDATSEALGNDVPVVILSGRNGTGKTQLFGEQQEGSREDYFIMDTIPDPQSSVGEANPFSSAVLSQYQVLHLDEATGYIDEFGPEALVRDIQTANREQGKQFVAVFPAVTAKLRADYVAMFEKELREQGVVFVNLGDVVEACIQPHRITELLSTLGVGEDTITLLSDVRALRSPRLFNWLMAAARADAYSLETSTYDFSTVLTPDYIREQVIMLTKLRKKSAQNSTQHDGELRGSELETAAHIPFLTQCLTTQAAIDLYRAFDIALPDPSEFPPLFIQNMGYDPYHKD